MLRTLALLLGGAVCAPVLDAQVTFNAPAGPQPFHITSPSADHVTNEVRPSIAWTSPFAATSYDVIVSSHPSMRVVVDQQSVTGTTAQVTADLPTGVYYARVDAHYTVGSVVESEVVRFQVIALPAWMPQFRLVTNDPNRALAGYRMVNLLPAFGTARIPVMVLINNEGTIVWWYDHSIPGVMIAPHVMPNGQIMFVEHADGPGYVNGLAFVVDWDKNLIWASLGQRDFHHDMVMGPGGNYLGLTWTWKEINGITYEGDGLALIDPATGNALWEWDIFDHFDPLSWPTPEIALPGLSGRGFADWTHSNAVYYDPVKSRFWMSVRHFDALVGIGYPSGDVEVVLGNRGLGGAGLVSHTHAPEVQPDGSILVYDNGNSRDPRRTQVTRIQYDETAGTAQVVWSWNDSYYDPIVGDADMMPNGNVLVTSGPQRRVMQVAPNGDIVWEVQIDRPTWLQYRAEHVPTNLIPSHILPFGR